VKNLATHLFHVPHTVSGKWSLALGAAFVLMFTINVAVLMPVADLAPWRQTVVPFYGILMILSGLGAGVLSALSIIRKQERSWLVWLMLLPGLFILFLLAGEIFFPH
jgi:hypothetical protein